MQAMDMIFYIIVLIFSVVVHEVSHGLMARRLGDKTAEYQGRLTLNPIPHIDILGSIVLPLLLVLSQAGFLIGWAKPVPYNPYNFYDKPWIRKWGEALVAFAGPLSNIVIFLVFGIFLRFFGGELAGTFLGSSVGLIQGIVLVNIVLAVFNMMPFPPLDGSKILFAILPPSLQYIRDFLEKYTIAFALFFLFFLWKFVSPVIFLIYYLVVGA